MKLIGSPPSMRMMVFTAPVRTDRNRNSMPHMTTVEMKWGA